MLPEQALMKWVRLLTPEAIGRLLGSMIAEPEKLKIEQQTYGEDEVRSMQQLTIGRVLVWLWNNQACSAQHPTAGQRKLEEAITRMAEPRPADKWASYVQNLSRLDRFMNTASENANFKLWLNRYKKARQQLLQHITIKTTLTSVAGMNNMSSVSYQQINPFN